MKKSQPLYQQTSPRTVDSSIPENGLLQPRVQTGVRLGLAAACGWKSEGMKPVKSRRAIRRAMKHAGVSPEEIETLLAAIGLEQKQ